MSYSSESPAPAETAEREDRVAARVQRDCLPVILLAGVLTLAATLAWVVVDASQRRHAHEAARDPIQATVRVLGFADLALSSSSRWLRCPSQTEPGAPFADAPAIMDTDPAGAFLSPPHQVLRGLVTSDPQKIGRRR